MTTPFTPVSWVEEPITTQKLNAMANNDQWLFENSPKMKFSGYGVTKTSGLKILATVAIARASTASFSQVNVYFGTFFSSGCLPIVVATAVPSGGQRRFIAQVNGISRSTPNHTGCVVRVSASEINLKSNKINSGVYCHVIAIGW